MAALAAATTHPPNRRTQAPACGCAHPSSALLMYKMTPDFFTLLSSKKTLVLYTEKYSNCQQELEAEG